MSTQVARFTHTALASERSPGGGERGELEFGADVAPGVTVTWDPATPRHCVAFAVEPEADVRPENPTRSSAVADRVPWLRLAAVTMLDRRLQLPLNRSLLDAEIAAAQVDAARTLSPAEPVRDYLVDKALVRARRAAGGLVRYLDRLTAAGRRPPPSLAASLHVLAGGYVALCAVVDDHDAALAAVTEAVDRLSGADATPLGGGRRGHAPELRPSGSAQIDPRLVPARLLRLGPTADDAEIDVVPVRSPDRPEALRVQVPAFEPLPDPAELPDLGLRLVHRRTGRVHGYGLLNLLDRLGTRCFEGIVSLPDAVGAEDVRVELHDADTARPRESAGVAELRRARRAALFLAGWRGLVADTRLGGVRALPATRLRDVIRTLVPDADRGGDEPLWAGGPALSHLGRIAELGDRKLASLLRSGARRPVAIDGDDGGSAAVVDSVSGPGDLLTAELAAAYDRAVPA